MPSKLVESIAASFANDAVRPPEGAHYLILQTVGCVHVARSSLGKAALVIELDDTMLSSAGRSAAGCDLTAHASVALSTRSQKYTTTAAVLTCHSDDLLQA